MAKKRKTRSGMTKRKTIKRGKPARRRAKRSGIADRISAAFGAVTGAARDTGRLRRNMRRQGMDES
jgi:hypothetical protein